jgi:hypothetical protein
MTALERVLSRVEDGGVGCWLWTGARHSKGYGVFKLKGKVVYVHRFIFLLERDILPGYEVHHTCHVRRCARPLHLQMILGKENAILNDGPPGLNSRKEYCFLGHKLPERVVGSSKRKCHQCVQAKIDQRRLDREYKQAIERAL